MEEEEFDHVTLDRGGDEKPRINGVFCFHKHGSPSGEPYRSSKPIAG
jgi:hypothetical protein